MSLLSNDEVSLLNSDNKFRNYVSSIEKALKNFESSTEWADLISSLNKLKKVLTSSPKYKFIPKRVSVCKRLAQCLHPALPSGVHLKALEVYTILFQNMGSENLAKDLFIYSAGLFPLLANAALSVKPVLLEIFETFYLPLKKALRPCLTGLILGILPGLEEGSDFYSRTFILLKNICIAQSDISNGGTLETTNGFDNSLSSQQIADEKYFYTCLWSAIVAQSAVRFPAIQFILTNYETKKKSIKNSGSAGSASIDEDQLYLIGNSIDLMINGICCCLQDTNPLVQRSVLDFVCFCLPMNTKQITRSDKLQLIVVAIHAVLRRDMSLNRRIYSWLMGNSNKPAASVVTNTNKKPNELSSDIVNNNESNTSSSGNNKKEDFFELHSKSLLIASIKMLLTNKKDSAILYLFNEEHQNFSSQLQSQTGISTNSSNMGSFQSSVNTSSTLHILKIVSNLVERQEIGQSIIDEILLDLLFYVYKESCSLNSIFMNSQQNYISLLSAASHNGHRRTHSNLMMTNIASSASSSSNSSQFKELNELKKASYNFMFESFQRYFIWEFCANKFELICKNYTEATHDSTNNMTTISPGQLCDLYEFILDLLKTNEMYAEIQSVYLPLMLKRIIKTLNTHCSKMSNLDLSKSILLCSKILKKVVPEIAIADHKPLSTGSLGINTTSYQRNSSETKNYQTSTNPSSSSSTKPVALTLATENASESISKQKPKDDESLVINDLLNDMISQIEAKSDEVQTMKEQPMPTINNESIPKSSTNENSYFIIESCVFYLKQLCHTFIRSHLIQSAENNVNNDKVKKSFQSLFCQKTSPIKSNSVNCLEVICPNCSNSSKNNEITVRENETGVQMVQLKPECLNYLQSFQIINKFLIKMLFFPRENHEDKDNPQTKKNIKSDEATSEQEDQNECCKQARKEKINKLLIDSFDEWIKDLFVISCCSTFINNTSSKQQISYSSKLFEFQSITINTIIELINLSESVNAHFPSSKISSRQNSISFGSNSHSLQLNNLNAKQATINEKVSKNTCLVQTVLTNKQINLIFYHSEFGNIVAKILWSHLSTESHISNTSFNANQLNSNNLMSSSNSAFSQNQIMSFNKTESTNDKRASILFCLLHETLPSNLCEDIVALNLVPFISTNNSSKSGYSSDGFNNDNVSRLMDALKRFIRLWHWSREINSQHMSQFLPSNRVAEDVDEISDFMSDFISLKSTLTFKRSTKTFERSLLIILDMLNDKTTPATIVKLIQDWIVTLICDYNDLPRILDILLVSLLHPNTARVSVQHYISNLLNNSSSFDKIQSVTNSNLDANESENNNDYESKVYAISHEDGNVKYHVNEIGAQKKVQTGVKQQVFVETNPVGSSIPSAGVNGASSTKTLRNANVELPLSVLNASFLANQGGIKMRINPLKTDRDNEVTFRTEDYIEQLENLENNSKNAAILEKYRTGKLKPVAQDKDLKLNASYSTSNSNASSPSHRNYLPPMNSHCVDLNLNNDDLLTDGGDEEDDTNNTEQMDDQQAEDENYFEDEEEEEDDDEEEDDENDYSNAFNINSDSLNYYPNSEDIQSHSTDTTLLKDIITSSNSAQYSSSGVAQTDSFKTTNKIDEKKLKRKSDLILSTVNKQGLINASDNDLQQQQKKSLSLTGRYKQTKSSTRSKENSPKLKANALNSSQLTLKEKSATIGGAPITRNLIKSNISPCRNFINRKATNNYSQNIKELTIDSMNSVDPNYSYLLLYTNCNSMKTSKLSHTNDNNKITVTSATNAAYDHTRTLFILSCLEQLLNKCPKEFLTSVTRTYVANLNKPTGDTSAGLNGVLNLNQAGFSVHNEKLLDLIVRHLKSIYGNSFYSDALPTHSFDLNKLNFNLNNVTYIEVITIILLFYIRSYYPPSQFCLINENSVANARPLLSNSMSSSSLNTSSASSNGSSVLSQCSTNTESLKSANTTTLSQSSPHLFINQPSNNFSPYNEKLTEDIVNTDEKYFNENRNVQIYCLQILAKIIKELISLCRFSSSFLSASSSSFLQGSSNQMNFLNGFLIPNTGNQLSFQPMIDLLDKCKLQKTLLHCFYSTIHIPVQKTLSQCILTNARDETVYKRKQTQYAYLSELMDSLENLIQLEKILYDFQVISKINRSNSVTSSLISNISNRNGTMSNQITFLNENPSQNDDDFLLTQNKKPIASHSSQMGKTPNVPSNSFSSNTANSSQRYIPIQSICNQPMFTNSILFYLRNINLVDYHLPILKLVRNSLPSAGNALKSLSSAVIEQLCKNLLQITSCNLSAGSSTSSSNYLIPSIAYMSSISAAINIPDLIISILKQLSYLLHYCLLSTSNMIGPNDMNSSPVMNQFMIAFLQNTNLPENQLKMFKQFQSDNETHLNQAKEASLNLLPTIMSSMTQVWQRCNLLLNSNSVNGVNVFFEALNQQQHQHQYSWILGHPIIIKQGITDILSPIVQHHGNHFMIAIGLVWGEKRKRSKLNQEHKVIIEIIKSLRICSIPLILQNITEIFKQSNSNTNKDKKKSPLNVWILQFLHSYLESYSLSIKRKSTDFTDALGPTINALCNFFRECLSSPVTSNLTHACYFQLFRILHDSVNNFQDQLVEDKKYSKDIQESTHKLFEICNSIVASSLQQTTWLRKNFAVKLQPTPAPNQPSNSSSMANSLNNFNSSQSFPATNSNPSVANPSIASSEAISQSTNLLLDSNTSGYVSSNSLMTSNTAEDAKYKGESRIASLSDIENEMGTNILDVNANLNSIDQNNGDLDASNLNQSLQALNILAEYLAKTLDIVYKSDEKERLVVPLLTSLMFNLWPYLKTHSIANKNNFRAASNLLMSLTNYPYTRKTWKKEVFEMLFDNLFFHVDAVTLEYCKTIIDNLISNDRQMFKEVLVKVQYPQSSGLFTTKEQESEQKAQLLKRLAFVIYSSEKDQYQKNMPEIQECIAHVLKLVQSPNLYSTLFLLFRILILRISGRHLIALWPTILTELIIILLQMEQELFEDIDSKYSSKLSHLDHIANTNSSLQQSNNTRYQIYLSACKLIDLILALPSSVTAQFQLCKWSFINTVDVLNLKNKDQFVPYLIKINNLLKQKDPNYKSTVYKFTGGPLISMRQIQSLLELRPFFETVNTQEFVLNTNQGQINQQYNSNQQNNFYLRQFEVNVHNDFLDDWL